MKEKKMPLYQAKPIIYNILDSIIAFEKKCPYYDKTFLFSCTKRNDFFQITIENVFMNSYDYSNSFGFFEYKKNTFICEGLLLNELLLFTGHIKIISYPIPSKNEFAYLDDRFSVWFYGMQNGKIYFIGNYPCPSHSSTQSLPTRKYSETE